ncbi:multicopper oxidase domain-containing protein [Nostocoides veronense]|uniref:Copper-containing nitrite reductase n=1 Tax=Nostocoides veronense TaxID=330836 RepID=A0ABN2LT44_9MICO
MTTGIGRPEAARTAYPNKGLERQRRPGRQGFWPWRDLPAVLWLVAVAAVTIVHPFLEHARWLMVHLVLLGALTHSAMVWSTHFSQALLKTGPDLDSRATQDRRAMLLFIGVAAVATGVVGEFWWIAVIGATAVACALLWHGWQLWRRLRAAMAPRFKITVRYYIASTLCVPIGATLGVLLARGYADDIHGRLLLAHTAVLVLGWIGLTVTGTLVTLWPTMLRSRMDDRAERLATTALPLFLASVTVIVAGALLGRMPLAAAGVLAWLCSALWWGRALWAPARRRPPREFASLSVLFALLWLVVLLVWVSIVLLRGSSWADLSVAHGRATAVLAAGFAPQLLLGALSYLVPVVLGGGPAAVRAATETMGRYAVLRLVLINGGLLLSLLPVPSVVRVLTTTLVLAAYVSFLPLMGLGLRGSLRARRAAGDEGLPPPQPPGIPAPGSRSVWSGGQLVAGLIALGMAVAVGVVVDPTSAGLPLAGSRDASAGVVATGQTTTVKVVMKGMRFEPASVTVPAGNRLVIDLTNTDPTTTHDLVLANGARTNRLRPGTSTTLDVGVVGASLKGWCSVVGHRQMGMVFAVEVTGATAGGTASAGHDGHTTSNPATTTAPLDLHAAFGPGFTAVDPDLPPAPSATVHRVTLTVRELELEVAPGVWQRRWTFNGAVPGPTLRGKVGDRFIITLVNDGSMGHSIDFHAGALAPDRPMRTIPPGASLTYTFTATKSGIWMYHCSSMPMSAHIAAGMHGAVIIDPPNLPKVDREFVLVQSELYLGANRAKGSADEISADAVLAEQPTGMTFNGIAGQYDQRPLTAQVGDRVRIWVLDAGPNRPSSFHVVGGQFDTVYAEGAWLLRPGPDAGGSQVLGLMPGQGGFVELVMPEAGYYPLVSHLMVDAERGAHGIVHVVERP